MESKQRNPLLITASWCFKHLFNLFPIFITVPIVKGALKGLLWIPKSANPGQVFGRYEPQQEEKLSQLLTKAECFWDVGAHVGWYTLLATQIIRNGRIVSFEPHPRNLQFLRNHVAKNGLTNVEILSIALSDRKGEQRFSGGSQFGFLAEQGDICVKTISADELIDEGYDTPDLLKIDIEGGEVNFLRGAKRLLTTQCPALVLSAHGYQKRDECLEILQNYGYEFEHLVSDEQSGDYVFYAKKLTK